MRTVTYDETKYRLVPLAPTREMLAAAQMAWINDPARKTSTIWRAMLAAAPDHPATAGDAEYLSSDADMLMWLIEEGAAVRCFGTQAGLRYHIVWSEFDEEQMHVYPDPKAAIAAAMYASKGGE